MIQADRNKWIFIPYRPVEHFKLCLYCGLHLSSGLSKSPLTLISFHTDLAAATLRVPSL